MTLRGLFLRLGVILSLLFLLVCGITVGVIYTASQSLPSVDTLNRFEPYLATEIFSADNQLIGKVFAENRELVSWKDIPLNLKNAVIATEDSRFYSHFGIDLRGILRAAVANFLHKGYQQGASTITQQLARNLFLSPEVSFKRKIKEALLAIEIEQRFSKDEILDLYLNLVYFGAGAYGSQAAADIYFGKPAKDLSLAECAMLAGLPQSPSAHNPFTNMAAAKARQKEVLERMVELHYISTDDAQLAYAKRMVLAQPKDIYQGLFYPYFTTYVVDWLFEKYPASLVNKGGLRVYTTMDVHAQQIAEAALRSNIDRGKHEQMHVSEGALVAVEPKTGYIKAMVGGYHFSPTNQFNRAWQAKRQPGSAFKIFVYTCALDHGYRPDTVVYDNPISFPAYPAPWSPRNDDHKFWGALPLRKALAYSRNVVAIRIASKLGIEKVIEYAHKMGVDEPLDPYLPTAIGASVVTPLEMVTAASTLANEGIRINPIAIKLIQDRNGNTLEDNRTTIRTGAVSAQTARLMTSLMQDVIKYGTGTRANIGRPAAGKTGTTSDFRDAWFVGFTPDLACVVWFGNDNFTPMKEAYGGYLPAMTWAQFMKEALKGAPPHNFTPPEKETKPQNEQLTTEKLDQQEPIQPQPIPSPVESTPTEEPNANSINRDENMEPSSSPDASNPAPRTSTSSKPSPSPSSSPTPAPSPSPRSTPKEVKKL